MTYRTIQHAGTDIRWSYPERYHYLILSGGGAACTKFLARIRCGFLPSFGSQLRYNCSDICMDADGLPLDLRRANGLTFVDTGVECVWIFSGHPPERILDDDRGVVANANFQKENILPLMTAQKFTVSLCRTVPSFVLYKGK